MKKHLLESRTNECFKVRIIASFERYVGRYNTSNNTEQALFIRDDITANYIQVEALG